VDEVVAHALRFKLVTPYTSFVAVERELRVDPTVPIARAVVPNALPEGVSYDGIFGPAREVQVLPGRVKPGDPELRVDAGPDAVAVRVALPFDANPRDAVRDPRRGDFVLRFLVPPAWPDGSFDARIEIRRAGGAIEKRVAPIRVDTTAAAVAVVAVPAAAEPGEEIRLALKPALPAAVLPALAWRPGGLGNALKGAIEVKEILVRAPWGEIARARMEGPLGLWVAALHVPADAMAGRAELEIVASDAAGNVSRRRLSVAIREGAPARPDEAVAQAGVAGVAVGAVVLAVAVISAMLLRRRRAPRPLGRRLLASTLRRADDR
jgi:Ca-activated chloride channel family protein